MHQQNLRTRRYTSTNTAAVGLDDLERSLGRDSVESKRATQRKIQKLEGGIPRHGCLGGVQHMTASLQAFGSCSCLCENVARAACTL